MYLEIEEEEDVGPDDSEPVGQRQGSQTEEGEPCLKSWPPMSNTQGTAQNRGQCCVSLSQDISPNRTLFMYFLSPFNFVLASWSVIGPYNHIQSFLIYFTNNNWLYLYFQIVKSSDFKKS